MPWIWSRRQEPQVRFCLAWLLPSWIVLELVAAAKGAVEVQLPGFDPGAERLSQRLGD